VQCGLWPRKGGAMARSSGGGSGGSEKKTMGGEVVKSKQGIATGSIARQTEEKNPDEQAGKEKNRHRSSNAKSSTVPVRGVRTGKVGARTAHGEGKKGNVLTGPPEGPEGSTAIFNAFFVGSNWLVGGLARHSPLVFQGVRGGKNNVDPTQPRVKAD